MPCRAEPACVAFLLGQGAGGTVRPFPVRPDSAPRRRALSGGQFSLDFGEGCGGICVPFFITCSWSNHSFGNCQHPKPGEESLVQSLCITLM